MFKEQRRMTDKLLFDYYMVSSSREEEVYSQFPFYLDKQVFDEMVKASIILDRLVKRIIDNFLNNKTQQIFQIDSFELLDEVLNLSIPLLPFFWVRYDVFQRDNGGIFFSEFNYDKPCAQREIAICDMFKLHNNPNSDFRRKFTDGLKYLWESFNNGNDLPTVSILVDPSHYEELHLAHLYIDWLAPLGYEIIITGGNNLHVKGDNVYAFDKKVDIILRQYPTEFLYEVNEFKEILKLYDAGKVLLLNDPRSIFGQTKSLFAYLWDMVERHDSFLSDEEVLTIKATIPYTRIFENEMNVDLIKDKDLYVIKAAYGRYSEEVYIGRMHDDEEWKEVIQYVQESNKLHILQEFCPIKKNGVLKFEGNRYIDEDAFGNFGIYLTNGEFSGICVRWSTDYLSSDDIIWTTAVDIREKSLQVIDLAGHLREQKWTEINDEAAFKWGYTDSYTGNEESFVLQGLLLSNGMLEEIKEASIQAVNIIKKTTRLVQDNYQLICPVLGISDKLSKLVTQKLTDYLTFIGRFDWVFDSKGSLRLLEFNSETPGGLLESIAINSLVKSRLDLKLHNPNENLGKLICDVFTKIIDDYSKVKDITNIGLISSSYHEDWYNITTLHEFLKDMPYNFIKGEVSSLKVTDNALYLYGTRLDAIYRYYPLDLFDKDAYYDGVLDAFGASTLSINPPSTLINQSKAFFALIWELYDNGFYNRDEANFIKKYIPKSVLNKSKLETSDFCAKPFFGWEGQGVINNCEVPPDFSYGQNEFVFQERVDIQPVELSIYTTMSVNKEIRYPIIGSYVIGDMFGGIFTRAGKRITDKRVVFIPAYSKD